MSAKECKRAQTQVRKRAQKDANELQKSVKIANNQVWNNQVWELPLHLQLHFLICQNLNCNKFGSDHTY